MSVCDSQLGFLKAPNGAEHSVRKPLLPSLFADCVCYVLHQGLFSVTYRANNDQIGMRRLSQYQNPAPSIARQTTLFLLSSSSYWGRRLRFLCHLSQRVRQRRSNRIQSSKKGEQWVS